MARLCVSTLRPFSTMLPFEMNAYYILAFVRPEPLAPWSNKEGNVPPMSDRIPRPKKTFI
jgi:hypothetical protein